MSSPRSFLPRNAIVAAILSLAAAASHAAPLAVDLPTQSLTTSIQQLSRQSGLSIGGDASLLEGKTAPAVKGNLEPIDALRRLLAGSGLTATLSGNSIVIGRSAGDGGVLEEVRVVADRLAHAEGGANVGYRTETAQTGPLGSTPLRDLPYTITVVPEELIQNVQASSASDALRYHPLVQATNTQTRGGDTYNIRGFDSNFLSSKRVDGLRAPEFTVPIEDKERLEVLSGVQGFLYGIASPGGLVNYVTKRPTPTPLASATVGNYGGRQYYVHADLGGRLDSGGRLGYRLNVMAVSNGKTEIDNQTHERQLVSAAIDWRLTRDTLLQFDASHFHRRLRGNQAAFILPTNLPVIAAPDASKNYAQLYAGYVDTTDKVSVSLKSQLSDAWFLRSQLSYDLWETDRNNINNTFTSSDGDYTQSQNRQYYKNRVIQGNLFLDATFDTDAIKHKVTVGYVNESIKNKRPNNPLSVNLPSIGSGNIANPTYSPEPSYAFSFDASHKFSFQKNMSYVLADQITFNDAWSVVAGVNYASLLVENYNATSGALTSRYDKAKATPILSLLFKPVPYITTYVSYLEALEQGGTAPTTAANSGTVFPPLVSKQLEAGVKTRLSGMDLTAAVFRLEKGNQFVDPDDNTYKQDGKEVHQGFEMTAVGKATERLTLVGGFTVFDATVKKSSVASLEGKAPVGVPEKIAKAYAEYRWPWLPELTLVGGVSYFGSQWNDPANTQRFPGVTTYDLGARYESRLGGYPFALRLNVFNAADKNYWLSPMFLGDPRTIVFSAEWKL